MGKTLASLLFVVLVVALLVPFVYGANLEGVLYDQTLSIRGNVIVDVNTVPKQTFISKTGKYRFNVPLGNYTINAEYHGSGGILKAEREVFITDYDDYVVDLILFPVNKTEITPPEAGDGQSGFSSFLSSILPSWFLVHPPVLIIAGGATLLVIVVLLVWFLYYWKKSRKSDVGRGVEFEHVEDNSDVIVEQSVVETVEKNDSDGKEDEKQQREEKDKKEGKLQPAVAAVDVYGHENLKNELRAVITIIRKEGGRTTQKDIRKYLPLSEGKVSLIITELEHNGVIQKIKKGRGNIIILK